MTLLILYAALALGVSFLCSLLEASLLSIPQSKVASLVEQNSAAGAAIKPLKDNIDRPLAAILTLNTIAHTVGAAGVGAQAAVLFGHAAVGIASAIMTLAILLLSEIIPKTLGAVHAARLVGFTAYTTRAMIYLCYPIIIVLERINRLITFQRHQGAISRMEILATIRLGHEGGALGEREHRVLANLLAINNVRLSEIITPRTVLFALPTDTTIGDAAPPGRPLRFARIPIYRDSVDQIIGYVSRYEVLNAASEGRTGEPLSALKRPILVLPELASVADALEQLLDRSEHIAVVVDEFGGVEGIVTLEDVFETILGQEIIDESDPIPDMQRLARRLAERRAAKSQSERD